MHLYHINNYHNNKHIQFNPVFAKQYSFSTGTPRYFEFIISDLDMPGEDGIELLKFIRTNSKYVHLPFLMLSGVNTKDQILNAITFGVSSYLIKPWEDKSIGQKIDSCWLKHGSR
jgi:CheY-like chemotaxis protein